MIEHGRRTRGVLDALATAGRAAASALAVCAATSAQMVWDAQELLVSRGDTAMAYDLARQRVVLFGGIDRSDSFGDTWEWDGARWERRMSATPPPPARSGHALAYDWARRRVVMFGGHAWSNAYLPGTWEWDGRSWTRRRPATDPPMRRDFGLAYDVLHQRVVMFGGILAATGQPAADTWEWDGDDWSQRRPPTSPPPMTGHALAYDLVRARVVLVGGHRQLDTWEWDGQGWARRTPATAPPYRYAHALVYDVAAGRCVLFGGANGQTEFGDTWEWDGRDWAQRQPAVSPSARVGPVAAYDTARGRVVLFGGNRGSSPPLSLGDTWEWDGQTWAETSAQSPHGRAGRLASDPVRGRVVLFGGRLPGWPSFADTWEWDGRRWIGTAPATSPLARTGHALAFDPIARRVLMFGGVDDDRRQRWFADTWHWDGATWTRRSPPSSPLARAGHALACDRARGRIVLFGGVDPTGALGDTWEWDGQSWALRTPATSPLPRWGHALAYDRARRRVLLFGGFGGLPLFADTWEWDGVAWTRRTPATVPPPRAGHDLAYDEARERVVLFGGLGANGHLADTWEWSGSDWLAIAPVGEPPRRMDAALAYDHVSRSVLLFGGLSDVTGHGELPLPGTWLYRPSARGAATGYGSGCGGSNGVPRIRAEGPPIVGNRDFALVLDAARPLSPAFVGVSARRASQPLGACTLYVEPPLIAGAVTTDGSGAAALALPIPFDPALSGLRLYAQAFVSDPNGAFGRALAFTPGLELAIGD